MTIDRMALDNTILRGVVGSTVHGTNIEGTDDRDEMGVCIEPPEYVIGLQQFEQFIQRDRPEGVRSEPGDLDLTIYSLRKWVRLALKGNPSILLLLFTPQVTNLTGLGYQLRALAPLFSSRQSAGPFLGFIQQQIDRLMRGKTDVHRPELIEKYGWDTKYGGHILRLAYQGVEYLSTGKLTLPMEEHARIEVLAVRQGEWSIDQLFTKANQLVAQLERLKDISPLPLEPDKEAIESWMIHAYQEHWDYKDYWK